MRLVVDDVMSWGQTSDNACHVRVWAPPGDSNEPQVVLLGQLQDFAGRSVSNEVETVAMTVAVRHLGATWRQAQFFEYCPSDSFSDDGDFLRITFTVKNHTGAALRSRRPRKSSEIVKTLGGELADPSWRRTSREEIERLTGETPQIWIPGTYTSALLRATSDRRGARCDLTWDPDGSRDLADVAAMLANIEPPEQRELSSAPGVRLDLSVRQVELAHLLLAQAAIAANERAEQDVKTQPADAAIGLIAPTLPEKARLFSVAERYRAEDFDPVEIWGIVAAIRGALVTSPDLEEQRRLLVQGLRGGWVPLRWYEAGVEEPVSERDGWSGPIALPTDLLGREQALVGLDQVRQLLLLVDVLTSYLELNWPLWTQYDVPAFAPSELLPTSGPLTRSYLNGVNWQPLSQIDPSRLDRLRAVLPVGRAGLDPDGWLVALSVDGKDFACEWPTSGQSDPTLALATIRADRPSPNGATPVYVERASGRLQLLPSAGDRRHGNAFTWGYSGTGPSNLAAAVLDLVRRAQCGTTEDTAAADVVRNLVASPRIPNWDVQTILSRAFDDGRGDNEVDVDSTDPDHSGWLQ